MMDIPYFSNPELLTELGRYATLMKLPEGAELIKPGEPIRFIPIVKTGCLRVIRQNEEGKEAFLYHILPGETCAMSLTCCNTGNTSEVKAIAEETTELYTIPISKLNDWQTFPEWREFIASTYRTRFERLLHTIDDLAFENLDERLWKYLLARAKAKGSNTLLIHHEEIAQELNIQRESATRLIRKLKDMDFIETSRGQITLLKDVDLLSAV